MDIFKIDQTSIDAIAYKAAKIVVSELKKCEEPQLEMVPVSVAAKILGISEDHMRRIKDKFPHIKNGNNKHMRNRRRINIIYGNKLFKQ